MNPLDIYRRQSESTDPGEFAGSYARLPSSAEAVLCHIHSVLLSSYPLPQMTEPQSTDIGANTAGEIMRALHDRGNPLTSKGPQETRFVGLCYHWSLLAVSILRSKGFACRVRCGFAPYLQRGKKGIDHSVIEVWAPTGGRWRLMDPELATIQSDQSTKLLGIDEPLDPLDVAPQHFHFAAVAWMNCRSGRVPEGFYGLYVDEPSYGFVRASLLRDWLNILGHEHNVSCSPPLKGLGSGQELTYLDGIAERMLDPDRNWEMLKARSSDIDFESAEDVAAEIQAHRRSKATR